MIVFFVVYMLTLQFMWDAQIRPDGRLGSILHLSKAHDAIQLALSRLEPKQGT